MMKISRFLSRTYHRMFRQHTMVLINRKFAEYRKQEKVFNQAKANGERLVALLNTMTSNAYIYHDRGDDQEVTAILKLCDSHAQKLLKERATVELTSGLLMGLSHEMVELATDIDLPLNVTPVN